MRMRRQNRMGNRSITGGKNMKKLETKGRSRKQRHPLFHKEMKQMKRLLSVCLCTSMISTSIGSTTALAATAPLLEKNEAEE